MPEARILDGKTLAAQTRADIAQRTARLIDQTGIRPGLGVILVGDDPASHSYVAAKEKACAQAGIYSRETRLPAETDQQTLLGHIAAMNADPLIHGILVQLPLPPHLDENTVIRAIDPEKDVDGFTPENVGRMIIGQPCFLPCTPHGVIHMLQTAGIETKGKHAVVIGRSNIVGKPLAHLLMRKAPGGNATVTVCHTATPDIATFTRMADIVIVAAGRPNTLTAEMVKPGATVIDVGVNRIPDPTKASGFRLAGDVDYPAVKAVAGLITPVPGGVGPMTITMLLENTYQSAARKATTQRSPR